MPATGSTDLSMPYVPSLPPVLYFTDDNVQNVEIALDKQRKTLRGKIAPGTRIQTVEL
jgi:hypothetical protein